MRPEKNATAAVAGMTPGLRSGKGPGHSAESAGADASGFMTLLALQGEDAGATATVAGADASALAVSDAPTNTLSVALDDQIEVQPRAVNEAPADLAFLLSQTGAYGRGGMAPPAPLELQSVAASSFAGSASASASTLPAVGAVSGSVQADLADAHGERLTDGESRAATAVGQEPRPIAGGRSTGVASAVLGAADLGPSSVDVLAQVRESARGAATVGGRHIARTAAEAQTALADLSSRVRVEDLRVAKLTVAADRMARTVALDPVMGRDALDHDARQIERIYSKMPADGAGTSSGGGFGSQLRFSAEMIDSSSATGGVETPAPEMYVAEQVKYLISRDIQNAELKLKGFDELPIDVHISMHGNDAHIDFRTDNVEIREVLQGAEAHLKDMLAKEGLVLSGVSVGTSLSDGRDAKSPQPQQFTRQQVFATEDPNQIIGESRLAPKSGSAIDVFV